MSRNSILEEIKIERIRQVFTENFIAEHDSLHVNGELATAAAAYAAGSVYYNNNPDNAGLLPQDVADYFWPHSWSLEWAKPKKQRTDLIKAAALIIAEIERLDNA